MAWHEVGGSGVDVEYLDALESDTPGEYEPTGWYWAGCSTPGCLPEGEWTGPFSSEDEALADCREQWEEWGE